MKILDIVFVRHLREPGMVKWHSRTHSHDRDQYELHCFISGDGSFRNGEAVYPIRRNQVFLSYPDQVHSIIPDSSGEPITYYAVLFEVDPGQDAFAGDLSSRHMRQGFPRILGSTFQLYLEDMKNKYGSRNAYSRAAAEHGLLSFLFDIFGRIESGDRADEDAGESADGASNVRVEQAMELFRRHIEGNIRLSEVSDKLKVSEEHLIKLFRKTIGITPMRYYQNLKMEAAVSMLLNSTMSVKEISWRLGYSSPYHFSRNFKQFSNTSPTDYRRDYYASNPTGYQTRIISESAGDADR